MPTSPLVRLERLARKPELTIAGLMTGTSLDGLDIALCRVGLLGRPIELLHGRAVPMAADLRRLLEQAMAGSLVAAARADMALGRWYADATAETAAEAGLAVDLVGSHGQTIYHEHGVTTLQIGEPGHLAARLDCPVAHDFRRADIVAGGCGAPLVPIFDRLVLGLDEAPVLAINIGGIANLSIVPPRLQSNREPLAFDCGPGNMVIDRLVWHLSRGKLDFDEAGAMAARGTVDEALLAELMRHPFLALPPPRSAGREQFGHAFADALVERSPPADEQGWLDLIATITAWTADSIASSLALAGDEGRPARAYVGGGGARNLTLMSRLEQRLWPVPIEDLRAIGVDPDLKEAMAFALLARLLVDGEAGNVTRATGAAAHCILGRLTFP